MKQIVSYSVKIETALQYPVNNETGLHKRPFRRYEILLIPPVPIYPYMCFIAAYSRRKTVYMGITWPKW